MMKHKKLNAVMATLSLLSILTGCGTSSSINTPHTSSTVHVAYAGSLELLNNQFLGPAFEKSYHVHYQGQGGGSYGIAHEIVAGSIPANVFESIGYGPVKVLEPAKTSWAIAIASSPLVVAYNPHSRFAPELNQIRRGQKPLKDLFQLMAQNGFKLGRTNPNTDPQGQAFVMAIELAQKTYHLSPDIVSRILGPINTGGEIYTEEGILSLLQSGGLDASSAFLSEAVQRHLDYIMLPPTLNFSDPALASWYHSVHVTLSNGTVVYGTPLTIDVTTVGKPANPNAIQFVRFLLSKSGQSIFQHEGYHLFSPYVMGKSTALPQALRQELNHA
ncbi:extracellular solute-binding protein [Sulfobacillus thermosulfidooxidans]|nr:extracellular solute-binding protein [Sulfobacillus thermosulfidooxidans]